MRKCDIVKLLTALRLGKPYSDFAAQAHKNQWVAPQVMFWREDLPAKTPLKRPFLTIWGDPLPPEAAL